jgi:hypothetical protein
MDSSAPVQVSHTVHVKEEETADPADAKRDFQLPVDKYKVCLLPLEKPQNSPVIQSFQRTDLCYVSIR